MAKNELLRSLPKIDVLTQDPRLQNYKIASPDKVNEIARRHTEDIRQSILNDEISSIPNHDSIITHILEELDSWDKSKLTCVINATGVVLHTNLGRSPISHESLQNASKICAGYSNLEYDLASGMRADRTKSIEQMICEITGAEDALVVNNNVAALSLCLNSLSLNKSVILSRGEMVEIGGSFRLPEIIKAAGCKLCEIGTTNVSRLDDYEKAISSDTGAILKVNPSNFSFIGYSEEVSLPDLSNIANSYDVPFIYDMGSGLVFSLERFGIDDMTIGKALASGADIVTFSCDKLLGGPQAGVIAGKREYIEAIRSNPLLRAVRVDKFTLATLQNTLIKYDSYSRAIEEIPTLRMLNATQEDLKIKADSLKQEVIQQLNSKIKKFVEDKQIINVEEVEDAPGGGCAPLCKLKGYALTVSVESPEQFCTKLRLSPTSTIACVRNNKVVLSVRTILDEQYEAVAHTVATVLEEFLGDVKDA